MNAACIRIGEDMYVSPQLAAESFDDIKNLGVKTIVNIRESGEDGFISCETEAKTANLSFAHFPVAYDKWEDAQVDKLLAKLDSSPKPCLVFCETGLRAAAIAVAYKESRKAVLEVLQNNRKSETPLMDDAEISLLDRMQSQRNEDSAQYKDFVSKYVQSKIENAKKRPGDVIVCDNFYIAGQVTEEELRKAKDSGIKAVFNLRCASEAGQFGLGFLSKEAAFVEKLGLKYVQLEVPRDGPYATELQSQVETQLSSLIGSHAPVLVHCRTGRRVREILNGTKFEVQANSQEKKLGYKVEGYVEPAMTPESSFQLADDAEVPTAGM